MLVLLSIIVVLNAKLATAEITDEKLDIIKSCENIFPDLEKLGTEKFRQRYYYFENFRSCAILFNDQTWYSDDKDRIEKLVALLDKPKTQSEIRDRFTQNLAIPEWIKADAKRWQQGKETDNTFAYGIRFLINSGVFPKTITAFESRGCENYTCISQNDFVKYSIKNSDSQDVVSLTYNFKNVDENSVAITAEKVSRNGKTVNNFQINKDGLVNPTNPKCCADYPFVHKTPLKLGANITSNFGVQITGEVMYPIKAQTRSAFLAKNLPGNYYEIIDEQTGIVLFAKHQDRIKKTVWTAELAETNIFTKEIKIKYEGMRIPTWFKTVVQWWTEGKLSNEEYLSAVGYLLRHNVLHI